MPNFYPNPLQPAIMPPTWSGTSINRDEVYHYLKILDVETKERYEHSGFFHVERKNEEDGIYGSISGLILPIELQPVFALVRKEATNKIWQIRSPLVFEIDFQLDADKEESHYFTLTSIKDIQIGEKQMVITEAHFQEVPNPIDLCQLIEIQRVFNKLLRRI